jgi:hypothetical protein
MRRLITGRMCAVHSEARGECKFTAEILVGRGVHQDDPLTGDRCSKFVRMDGTPLQAPKPTLSLLCRRLCRPAARCGSITLVSNSTNLVPTTVFFAAKITFRE